MAATRAWNSSVRSSALVLATRVPCACACACACGCACARVPAPEVFRPVLSDVVVIGVGVIGVGAVRVPAVFCVEREHFGFVFKR